jgi:hypothetical protein
LVTLNTFYSTVADLDPELADIDAFLAAFNGAKHMVRTPPTKLPASVRRHMLSDIGFTDKEIAQILLSAKCHRYSDASTNLVYTNADYVPTMKSRLHLIRADAENLSVTSSEQMWSALTNW